MMHVFGDDALWVITQFLLASLVVEEVPIGLCKNTLLLSVIITKSGGAFMCEN